jgi:hypothetical protein
MMRYQEGDREMIYEGTIVKTWPYTLGGGSVAT